MSDERACAPELERRITRALGHVWFSSLLGWVNGWKGMSETGHELDSAAHLLLDQYGWAHPVRTLLGSYGAVVTHGP